MWEYESSSLESPLTSGALVRYCVVLLYKYNHVDWQLHVCTLRYVSGNSTGSERKKWYWNQGVELDSWFASTVNCQTCSLNNFCMGVWKAPLHNILSNMNCKVFASRYLWHEMGARDVDQFRTVYSKNSLYNIYQVAKLSTLAQKYDLCYEYYEHFVSELIMPKSSVMYKTINQLKLKSTLFFWFSTSLIEW